jgi:azurin
MLRSLLVTVSSPWPWKTAVDHRFTQTNLVDALCNRNLNRRQTILGMAAVALAGCSRPSSPGSLAILHVASDGDQLAFKPDHLFCRTGSHVHLFFHHAGQILDDPHDWVLLRPGHLNEFLADAERSPDNVVIPAHDQTMVLAATSFCGKQHTVLVEFTAPAPGSYDFVCSVPGHGQTMRGILTVTV